MSLVRYHKYAIFDITDTLDITDITNKMNQTAINWYFNEVTHEVGKRLKIDDIEWLDERQLVEKIEQTNYEIAKQLEKMKKTYLQWAVTPFPKTEEILRRDQARIDLIKSLSKLVP